jgi:hypothetical protein
MGRMPIEEKLDAQLKFHRVEWRIQRFGWFVILIFLALAFAGLFGNGPLSHAHADGPAGRVEYERFVRNGAPTKIVVIAGAHSQGISRIAITQQFLEAMRIQRITPEPVAVHMQGDALIYQFATEAPAGESRFISTRSDCGGTPRK